MDQPTPLNFSAITGNCSWIVFLLASVLSKILRLVVGLDFEINWAPDGSTPLAWSTNSSRRMNSGSEKRPNDLTCPDANNRKFWSSMSSKAFWVGVHILSFLAGWVSGSAFRFLLIGRPAFRPWFRNACVDNTAALTLQSDCPIWKKCSLPFSILQMSQDP